MSDMYPYGSGDPQRDSNPPPLPDVPSGRDAWAARRRRQAASVESRRAARGNAAGSGTDLSQWRGKWREDAEEWLRNKEASLTDGQRQMYQMLLASSEAPDGVEPLAHQVQVMRQALEVSGQSVEDNELDFIGGSFYDGDQTVRPPGWTPSLMHADPTTGRPRESGGNFDHEGYREGDETFFLRNMSVEELARLQDRLYVAGFVDDYTPGEWRTGGTVQGFGSLLGVANASGRPYQQVLTEILTAQSRADREGTQLGNDPRDPAFIAPTRPEPDRTRIMSDVQGYAEQRLGRKLDDDEAERLAGALIDIERTDFDRRIQAAQVDHDAQVAAGTTGADQAPVAPEYGPNVVAARFEELFDQRFEGEMDYKRASDAATEFGGLLRGGISRLAGMVGG